MRTETETEKGNKMTKDEQIRNFAAKLENEREELLPYFNRITAGNEHWKDEINAVIPVIDFAKYNAAVEFFTATTLRVIAVVNGKSVQVVSEGYRRGPAGDH
jgi:hypothetical protein